MLALSEQKKKKKFAKTKNVFKDFFILMKL
jgi:hypothetical protein